MSIKIQRSDENPILVPDIDNSWEAESTFNGCPVKGDGIIHFLYRAISIPQQYEGLTTELSTIGYANSKDGIHFQDRRQFVFPEYAWEHYGCEDPRVTKIGGNYFIFYTALSTYPFSQEGIKIGLAITKDFKTIKEKHLITHFNAKAMALFPSKIGGLYKAILTVNTDKPPAKIAVASFEHISQLWSPEYWTRWYGNLDRHVLHIPQATNDHLELGAPPLKTRFGWLLLYSHIENYFLPPATFGIRALLLDLEKPHRFIARTEKPLLIPEASYERFGKVPNIVFPTGVLKNRNKIHIYYGAADTTCAMASTNLESIINNMTTSTIKYMKMERYPGNPVMIPKQENQWEAKAVFNPAALHLDGKIYLVYRAISEDNTSVMGLAISSDGFTIDERLDKPIYVPRDKLELKGIPYGNSGCEDPRLTIIEDTIYMLYTAYRGDREPRVALTSIAKNDFLSRRWKWARPKIISPPGMDDKDAALFPDKINGQYALLHRLGVNIWLDLRDDLDFGSDKWLYGKEIITPEDDIKGTFKVGIAGPPLKTERGWLLLYHGVTDHNSANYHLTAAMLDLYDPSRVLAVSDTPILEPEMAYEKEGIVSNVVFPCGNILKDELLIVYYGAADRVVGIATMRLNDLLNQILS